MLILKTCYAIIKISNSGGSETDISLVLDGSGAMHLSFSTPEEAKVWIRRIVGRKAYWVQQEHHPATYAVARVGSERFNAAYRSTFTVQDRAPFARDEDRPLA